MTGIRNLSRANVLNQKALLTALASYAEAEPVDSYGGETTERLERRLADLFGKEACAVMPSGKAAQNSALKVWAGRTGSDRIAIHPRSHIEEEEGKAHAEVFGLRSVAFGSVHAQPSLADLKGLRDPVGAASVEIALRPLGGTLIPWDELTAISEHCRQTGIPFHADGARIWESQPGYGKPFPEIAALFDSLYVSLYKIIGGLFGGALLGPRSLIDETRAWQQRLGQSPYRQFPFVLAAMKGLDEELPRVPDYCRRARELSMRISELDGIAHVTPRPAHTNMFQVHIEAPAEDLMHARDRVVDAHRLDLFNKASGTSIEGVSMFEVIVGPATMELTDAEILKAFRTMVSMLRGDAG